MTTSVLASATTRRSALSSNTSTTIAWTPMASSVEARSGERVVPTTSQLSYTSRRQSLRPIAPLAPAMKTRLFMPAERLSRPSRAENALDRLQIAQDRVAHEPDARQRALPCLRMTRTAGIRHNDRDVAEVGAMQNRWFDADLGGDPYDDEGVDAAVSKSDVQWRRLECGHRDLVEDDFARQRLEFRDELESRRSTKEPRLHFTDGLNSLPGHRHAQLEDPRGFIGQ